VKARHSDTTPAWIARRFAKIEKQLREMAAAKKLQAATIGKGGVTIKDGGTFLGRYPVSMGGGEATRFGPVQEGPEQAMVLSLLGEGGDLIFRVARNYGSIGDPDGASSLQAIVQQFLVAAEGVSLFGNNFGSYVGVDSTGVILDGGASGVKATHSTTGSSANCFIDPSDGRLWRSTSSRRYKQDIENAEVDPAAVLDMQPRTWRDKGEVEKDPETEKRYVGFIAEELDELGLDQFVVYDADDKPEAIAYDRLSVALLAVLKDQDARLAALEAEAAKP
jgi:hypothetical protein